MKIFKKIVIAIFILLIFIFLYYGARQLFLSDGFDKTGFSSFDSATNTFVYSNSITILRYPEKLEMGEQFSFYRHYKLPELPVIKFLPIDFIFSEKMFKAGRKSEYNLCFENISEPYPLVKSSSCEWLNCTGYRYSAGNYSSVLSPDELDSEIVNMRDAFVKSFPEDEIPTRAKLTKDKSCANYKDLDSLFEYEVEYKKIEQEDLLLEN